MSSNSSISACALSLLLLSACVDGGSKDEDDTGDTGSTDDTGTSSTGDTGDTGDTDEADLNECIPFTPAVLTGTFEGTLQPDETHASTTFTAPSDRLTGVVTFSLVSPYTDSDSFEVGVTFDHPIIGIDDREGREPGQADVAVAGALAPGETVTLTYIHWDGYHDAPYDFATDWTWTETDDCYEPNDDITEARHIPTDETLSAWMISGVGDDPSLEDWYRFTLTEPSTVSLQVDCSDRIYLGFTLWAGRDDTETVDYMLYADPAGQLRWTSDGPLPKGTYTLLLSPFVSMAEVDYPYSPIELQMFEPYTFSVTTTPAR